MSFLRKVLLSIVNTVPATQRTENLFSVLIVGNLHPKSKGTGSLKKMFVQIQREILNIIVLVELNLPLNFTKVIFGQMIGIKTYTLEIYFLRANACTKKLYSRGRKLVSS